MQEIEAKVEGIGLMSFRVFWFVVAGFVLGFVTSTLWEWLYYRQKRIQSLTSHSATLLAARRSHGAESEEESDDSMDVGTWKLPAYRSSGILLESEEQATAPTLAGMSVAGVTQPKPATPTADPNADPTIEGDSRPFALNERNRTQTASPFDAPIAEHHSPTVYTAAESTAISPSTTEQHVPASTFSRNQFEQAAERPDLAAEVTSQEEEPSTGNSQAIARASAIAAATLGAPRVVKRPIEEAKASIAPPPDLNHEPESAVEAPDAVSRSATAPHPLTTPPIAPARSPDRAIPLTGPLPTQPFVRRPTDYPDDLAMIKGIGEAYKRRLYASGIYTWMQLSESDIDSLRRITRAKPNADIESWQTQARLLAEKYQRTESNFTGPLDDFTRIEGIGAITADILYKAGICIYEQLAALLPDELARIVPAPTVGSENDFDGWINDATRLATAKRRNNGLLA